ncbi:acyl-CoA dehydrogenase C-terminal domain-containing protein [Caulobacter sp. UC70_42]|uniref:acyl-CoA dehydrogenase C-terminal domain-containing protein n=1 Tax=Caulobacter sp. UC70_42 TaxID=3374551 RepID=UPI0037579624
MTHAWSAVVDTIEGLRGRGGQAALANATPFLWAFGHVVVAWLWLDQATAVPPGPDDFAEGKRRACRYFFECELPKVDALLAFVASGSDVASDAPVSIF